MIQPAPKESWKNEKEGDSSTAPSIQQPAISLPKGGGGIKGIDEKFQVNSVNGTASFSIPVPLSPSRHGFTPSIGLAYNSGSGNSAFGLGWDVNIPRISRKTQNELPQYRDIEESDTFILSGTEDLIPLLEQTETGWQRYKNDFTEDGVLYSVARYRPRIEGSFALIERWTNKNSGEAHWRTISNDNIHSYYGLTTESQLSDPDDTSRTFEWRLCRAHDDKGNITIYEYKQEDYVGVKNNLNEKNRIGHCTQLYIKRVLYGNRNPYFLGDDVPPADAFLFQAVFDYGEHDSSDPIQEDVHLEKDPWICRDDPFSSYRAGFEIRTYRRCNRILIFHCFDAPDLPISPYLVKSLQLFYNDALLLEEIQAQVGGFSYLVKARHNGHIWDNNKKVYTTKFLPELEMSYQQLDWNTRVESVTPENILNAPLGINDKQYLWIDLFNEGIAGILAEQDNAWYYKSNLGNGNFSVGLPVAPKPSPGRLSKGNISIQDLEGNGIKYLVQSEKEQTGFFKINEDDEWEPYKDLAFPNIDRQDPNLRAFDLTGTGRGDLVLTDKDCIRWYPSLGEQGFDVPRTFLKEMDEEKGPAVIFADPAQSIYLADMTGDGLMDIVRIRNGEVCYWPNLGYGKFGAKVNMDHAPVFDIMDSFNPLYLRLADIDGSGTTDIVYLGRDDFRVWMNLNGNEWTQEPQIISSFPGVNDLTHVSVLDVLGSGTASIVHSSRLPQDQHQPLRYIDLAGSKKPHLLTGYRNNCGKEISIEYKSSASFYLDDKKAGRKWITKLPFPVQCVYKVTSEDKIRQTIFTSSYTYRHGYFDFVDKEFRGFARVEQVDSESFAQYVLDNVNAVKEVDLYQAPIRSVSWFHTGAFLRKEKILHQCKSEYFNNILFDEYDIPEPLIINSLTPMLSPDELRDASRSLKGLPLRTEVYAEDGSDISNLPYSASESTYDIHLAQPKDANKYPSFFITPSESISYTYERQPADPRIAHSFVLETDELGNTKKSASIVYPRIKKPSPPDNIPDKVWEEQNLGHIAYTESFYTDDKIDDANRIYRLRVGFESKGYEISGIPVVGGIFITRDQLRAKLDLINGDPQKEISFEAEFDGTLQKRLSSHSRIYFWKDDLSAPLPLGKLSNLGILHKSYTLAYTPGLITKYFGNKVTNAMLIAAKYLHLEGDDQWWVQPGVAVYAQDPKANFYTVVGSVDVFDNATKVEYDKYTLLLQRVTDAIGSTMSAAIDYRTLSPVMVTDANLNRSAVQTDELGFVVKSAAMGKDGANEGDTLADPTARMEYDLFNWQQNQKPNYVHAFAREKHGAANPRWQESYIYSDGGGSAIMAKAQAHPGVAKKWNPVTKKVEEINTQTRWIGNGRTILNNKGKPVKQYEPYFSATSDYENESDLVETGITPIFYYDPVGRNIRTEFPNGTFSKVEFDAWYSKSFDVNDTVKDSQWYTDRGSPNPDTDPEPTNDQEKRAAWLAAKHYDTPGVIHSDSLGRPFYTITDYGNGKTTHVHAESDLTGRFSKVFDQKDRLVAESYNNLLQAPVYGRTAEKGERWIFTDVMGRLVKLWDNNVREFRSTYDSLHRPVSAFVKDNTGETLFGQAIYAETVLDIPTAQAKNMKGRVFRMYDQDGSITITKVDFKGNALEVQRKIIKDYTKSITDLAAVNGLTTISSLDSAETAFLDPETFNGSGEVDALNRPTKVTVPGGTIYQPFYNEANFLQSLQVQVQGNGPFITFLEAQDYDAKGQRQFVQYGNGNITQYFYDPKTYRLINLLTKQSSGDVDSQSIQDLTYTFDPVGNITSFADDAQTTHFFQNKVVPAANQFKYDAVYQLKDASGREHGGLGGNAQRDNHDIPFIAQIPHPNDSVAVRPYTEAYEYDDMGNITRIQHVAGAGSWTRQYHYEYEDDANNCTNRLKATSTPNDPVGGPYTDNYVHDLQGNMTSMPHLSAPNSLVWNFMDQLQSVNLGGGGMAYYVYSTGGKRTRKVIERQGQLIEDRIYVGAVEIYRKRQGRGTAPVLERYTIHISDNTGRIAQVDIKTIDTDNSDPNNPLNDPLIRYQFHNHLGSATLETDDAGNIISCEEYHPYGTTSYHSSKSDVDLSLKRYRFSGKERDDETGFYYFGARYYAAWLGRWTSSDPGGFVNGFNLFKYCSNNPVVHVDPNGMQDTTYPVPKDKQQYVHKHTNTARDELAKAMKGMTIVGKDKQTYELTNPTFVWRDKGWYLKAESWTQKTSPTPNPVPALKTGVQDAINPTAGSVTQEARNRVGEPRSFSPGEKLEGPYNLWSNEPGGGLKDAAKAPGFIMEDTSFEDVAEATAKSLGYTGRYDPAIAYGSQDFESIWYSTSDALATSAGVCQMTVTSNGLESTRIPPPSNPSGTVQMSREIPRIQVAGGLMAQVDKVSGILTIVAASQIDNPYVRYTGYVAGGTQFVAGNAYLIGSASVGSGYFAASTTSGLMTFGRYGGRAGGGIGMIAISGYALVSDIENGNYGVTVGDSGGVVSGMGVLAGSGPVAIGAGGIALANYGGDWAEKQVTPAYGRKAGIAAGGAVGLGIGGTVGGGLVAFGLVSNPVGWGILVAGGIAGLVGAIW